MKMFTWLLLDSTSHMYAVWAWRRTIVAKFTYLLKSCSERAENHYSINDSHMFRRSLSLYLTEHVTRVTSKKSKEAMKPAREKNCLSFLSLKGL